MNEIELIRTQLLTERTHAAQVAHACATAIGAGQADETDDTRAFRDACVSYLVWVLARFEQRDQLLAEHLQTPPDAGRAPRDDAWPAGLGEMAARPGTSREALAKLEAALGAARPEAARTAWQAFARFFHSVWSERRTGIEDQLTRLTAVAGWRAVCAVDADSILEERSRYAAVLARLPAGIALHETRA